MPRFYKIAEVISEQVLSMAPYYAMLPEDIAVPHNTIWATVTVGSLFTIAATAIMFAGQHPNQNSGPLAR
ncbi:hypothetical protein FHS27_006614 [Rhodopirellula rubra]|uniref:Uncharacterized protein n=1 Tax=Aporhodopirellula rubra TaxID=980271 RepID=A0A7W5E5Y5_9BACT|nr:hypothetical protein [Aporhodopirellula rubra]MBB3210765.1 hypothetical protein [Aporhodopirellula rubra]